MEQDTPRDHVPFVPKKGNGATSMEVIFDLRVTRTRRRWPLHPSVSLPSLSSPSKRNDCRTVSSLQMAVRCNEPFTLICLSVLQCLFLDTLIEGRRSSEAPPSAKKFHLHRMTLNQLPSISYQDDVWQLTIEWSGELSRKLCCKRIHVFRKQRHCRCAEPTDSVG